MTVSGKADHTCCGTTLLGTIPRADRRVPHISLVFREMSGSAGLPFKLLRAQQNCHPDRSEA